MASGDELRAQAREFERAHRFTDALDVYARLVEEASGGEAALLWQRVAAVQERTDSDGASSESYSRAVALYVASGQRNNALAVCLDIADRLPIDPTVALTRLRLSLELGYPVFARDAIDSVLLQAVQGDAGEEAGEDIATFLIRHGKEPRYTPAELVERLPAAAEQRTASLLHSVWRILSSRGVADVADRVRAEIIRIQPGEDPAPTTARPSSTVEAPEPTLLPLIETTAFQDDAVPLDVPLLEGLEPTNAGLERERDQPDTDDLPLTTPPAGAVGQAPLGDAPSDDRAEELDEDEYEDEPLPLLIPTDRAYPDASPETSPWASDSDNLFEVEDEIIEDLALDTGFDPADAAATVGPNLPELDIPAITDELGRVVGREVEPSDPASHYDVGVAFKEMGMTEDALARLAAALAGGYNPVATLEVIGEILVEQSRTADAARVLGFARSTGSEFDEGMAGVLYWLARSDEVLGRAEEARDLFARVVRVAPSFRDASERLSALPVQ